MATTTKSKPNLYQKLAKVQAELKVPKAQRNTFGGYNYRSSEDIMEAAKPLLAKHGLTLFISDTIEQSEGRWYLKAVITLVDTDDPVSSITTYGWAREEESKKGMDGSQITGASSSYARKYALNGLLLIDDTKDSDATNTHGKGDAKPAKVEGVIFPEEWEQKISEVAKQLIASGKLDEPGYQKARVKYATDPATMHAKMTELAA